MTPDQEAGPPRRAVLWAVLLGVQTASLLAMLALLFVALAAAFGEGSIARRALVLLCAIGAAVALRLAAKSALKRLVAISKARPEAAS